MDIEEKKEVVIMHFEKSYDLENAMMLAQLTSDEKSMLKRDTSFQFRIDYILSKVREEIVQTLLECMRGPDLKLARTAGVDLGKILWGEKFNGKTEEGNKNLVPDTIVLKGAKPKDGTGS